MSRTLELAQTLIRRASVSPRDEGCLEILGERLAALGFHCERIDIAETSNLWARRGDAEPLFVLAGHTDVVPSGPVEQWSNPPFEARVADGWLHGRGAADMKGALAAMIGALERFTERFGRQQRGSLGLLLTSDEEGAALHGTRAVMDILEARGERISACVIGEPSSTSELGDVIKHGRRGSLSATLRVIGVQGHVAYPEKAENPIHRLAPALAELVARTWDEGFEGFPPTSLQVSNIRGGTGAGNVIPGHCEIDFNLRFSPARSEADLRAEIEEIFSKHGLRTELRWAFSGPPFLTREGELIEATKAAIRSVTGRETELSTSGGTSDGRFIAPRGVPLVELGLCNATIHKIDERVRVQDLNELELIYENLLDRMAAPSLSPEPESPNARA